jgi:hypothetical protein
MENQTTIKESIVGIWELANGMSVLHLPILGDHRPGAPLQCGIQMFSAHFLVFQFKTNGINQVR